MSGLALAGVLIGAGAIVLTAFGVAGNLGRIASALERIAYAAEREERRKVQCPDYPPAP